MRILNIDAPYFVNTFKKMGHHVLTLSDNKNADIPTDKILSLKSLWDILNKKNFFPDLVFWADSCRPPLVAGLEELPALCAGFSVDQYLNPWHVPYSAGFDLFLVAQKDYCSLFNNPSLSREILWFPLFCNPSYDKDLQLPRDINISFVGTLDPPLNPDRWIFLEKFKEKEPLVTKSGPYQETFNRSRMVLNQSAAGELNFRLFQAMACGCALLTEDSENGLHDLFTPGEDLFVYPRGDAAAAVSICRKALSDRNRLQKTAANGRRKVLSFHTVRNRVETIIQKAETLLAEKRPQQRISVLSEVRAEMAKAFIFLATDSALPLEHASREFYLNLGNTYTYKEK